MNVGLVDYDICRKCQNGAFPKQTAEKRKAGQICCPLCQDMHKRVGRTGRVRNNFKNPSERKAWAVDVYGKNVAVKGDD